MRAPVERSRNFSAAHFPIYVFPALSVLCKHSTIHVALLSQTIDHALMFFVEKDKRALFETEISASSAGSLPYCLLFALI
jgi:hypothetical protein